MSGSSAAMGKEKVGKPPGIMTIVGNIDELRSFLSSPVSVKTLQISEAWSISSVVEWLQKEIQYSTVDYGGLYQKKCTKCLNMLVRKHHIFPSSFFYNDVRRDGLSPVAGGGFADVYKGTVENQTVCLKVLRVHTQTMEVKRQQMIEDFYKEALIWTQLCHPNVLQLLGVNTKLFKPDFCLVSPWMDNSDIITFLKKTPDHDRLRSIREIAAGLEYLHCCSPMIVHGDIKGANILVDENCNCRLADFGLAMEASGTTIIDVSGMRGSVPWMAPELFEPPSSKDSNEDRSPPKDIYAYACTIFEIMTGRPPFSHLKTQAAVIAQVLLYKARPTRPTGVWCPDNVWQLVEKCWDQDRLKRPIAKHIHEYLTALYETDVSPGPDTSTRFHLSLQNLSQLTLVQSTSTDATSSIISQSTQQSTQYSLNHDPQASEAMELQDAIAHSLDAKQVHSVEPVAILQNLQSPSLLLDPLVLKLAWYPAQTRDYFHQAVETVKLCRKLQLEADYNDPVQVKYLKVVVRKAERALNNATETPPAPAPFRDFCETVEDMYVDQAHIVEDFNAKWKEAETKDVLRTVDLQGSREKGSENAREMSVSLTQGPDLKVLNFANIPEEETSTAIVKCKQADTAEGLLWRYTRCRLGWYRSVVHNSKELHCPRFYDFEALRRLGNDPTVTYVDPIGSKIPTNASLRLLWDRCRPFFFKVLLPGGSSLYFRNIWRLRDTEDSPYVLKEHGSGRLVLSTSVVEHFMPNTLFSVRSPAEGDATIDDRFVGNVDKDFANGFFEKVLENLKSKKTSNWTLEPALVAQTLILHLFPTPRHDHENIEQPVLVN
ncbi:kinase-like protein [Marasmius fiardii PR-910]|nr:kinase-like protein [Marasmius fiardii PR-910]